jgi:hypothetical protein
MLSSSTRSAAADARIPVNSQVISVKSQVISVIHARHTCREREQNRWCIESEGDEEEAMKEGDEEEALLLLPSLFTLHAHTHKRMHTHRHTRRL